MVVNPLVENRMNAVFDVTTADEKQTVKAYLATLASQKNIIMGHTPAGDIYFTQAETNVKPVYKYQPGTTLINNLSLSFGGQSMHSEITVQKQAGTDGGNFSVTTIKNPFVTAFRPKVINQSSGDDNTTSTAARNALGDELKNLKLTAYAVDWLRPDGKIWRPGDQITVIEPELGITTETTWFIESVRMDGDTTRNTAILNMVLPYVYNNETVKTIFS
jgi:prophage tail gpP-like protein